MEKAASKDIVFVHGMFQNPESWKKWEAYFEQHGYRCHAPAYPYHEGNPAALRAKFDPALGRLTFGRVVESLAAFIDRLPAVPILIGHSMGALAVQKLINTGKGTAGVCIDSAPPLGVFSLKWSFWRSNYPSINLLKGNSVNVPSVKWFHYAFCNTMTMEETQREYDLYVVPESRNVPRSTLGPSAKIDFKKPHVPLLLIAGEKDHIIPPSVNRLNFKRYKDAGSKTDFKVFPDRTHYICGMAGWEEVAAYIADWLESTL